MEPKNILGWIFLIFGLLLIFYVVFSSYQIFTGKSLPPNVFKEKEEKKSPAISQKPLTPEEKAEAITREEFQKQIQKILPAEKISQLLNLISWSILAGILIFAGSQISSLGIKLIKK